MRPLLLIVLSLACTALFAESPTTRAVRPLTNVHAHNDYAHERPLSDALDCGFCSVEADVSLVKGQLLVAHAPDDVELGRSLQSLYLEPLRQRIQANGGRVYQKGPAVILLVDIKTPFDSTYPILRNVLRQYESLLTSWAHGKKKDAPLVVIVTGNRRQSTIAADEPRLCACDGELADLDANPPADLVPWISVQWTKVFKWKAGVDSPMPDNERAALKRMVDRAHQQGRKLRFWGGPDNSRFWAEELSDGVDLLNTDHLHLCRDFLLSQR
jgi:hypothetical protein